MIISGDKFLTTIKGFSDLYFKVRYYIILAEKIDKEGKIYIGPLNELRNALDHIFKSVVATDSEHFDYEMKEVKEHMVRAGWDVYEVMALNIGDDVVDKIKKYDTDTLTKAFPDYYPKIKPEINAIKKELAKIKQNRQSNNFDDFGVFDKYFDQIEKYLKINEEVDNVIPSLEEYKRKKTFEKWKDRIAGFFIAVIIGIILFILTNPYRK
jgi:hypothetical protein